MWAAYVGKQHSFMCTVHAFLHSHSMLIGLSSLKEVKDLYIAHNMLSAWICQSCLSLVTWQVVIAALGQ